MNGSLDDVVDSYLNSPPPARPLPQVSGRLQHASERTQNRPYNRPYITEGTVRRKLANGETTFTEAEVRIINSLLEKYDSDPFAGEPFITPTDLKALGLKTVDAGADVYDDDDKEGDGEGVVDAFTDDTGSQHSIGMDEPIEKFPVTAALCAPDNTVGGAEPIPQEVLATLDVLKSNEPEHPVSGGGAPSTPTPPPPAAAAPAQASSTPVSSAFPPSGGESPTAETNDILKAFESVDYMAQARAAIMGETVTTAAGGSLTEDGNMNVSGALNMVRAFRASKQPAYSPPARRTPPKELTGVSDTLAASYKSKLGALGGSAD